MKSFQMIKFIPAATGALLFSISMIASAVDRAEITGDVAKLHEISVSGLKNVSDSALGGDPGAIQENMTRSHAIDAAVAAGMGEHQKYENALSAGDEDAAAAHADNVKTQVQKAEDALSGALPEDTKQMTSHEQWKESKTNTGSGPGRAYDPPNIYDVPWESQGVRSFYQSLWGNFWASSGGGGARRPGDRDATPE
jgi:hypothetical protein